MLFFSETLFSEEIIPSACSLRCSVQALTSHQLSFIKGHFIRKTNLISVDIYGKTALIIFGKATVETTFEMIYIATSEIYPTTARVTALGVGSAFARLGGAISPYLALSVS